MCASGIAWERLLSSPFKFALQRGDKLLGLRLPATDADVHLPDVPGLRWVLIDADTRADGARVTLARLQPWRDGPVQPVVRVPGGDALLIGTLLRRGVRNLLLTGVKTARQARNLPLTLHPRLADESVCLLLQLDSSQALQELPEIVAEPLVQGIFLTPHHTDAAADPQRQQALQASFDNMMRTVVASGKAAGTQTTDLAVAQRWFALGAGFVAITPAHALR